MGTVAKQGKSELTLLNNVFNLQLLGVLPRSGNIFYSGLNIRMALAMVYAGARAETAREMADVLGFTDSKNFHLSMYKIREELEKTETVKMANNVWVASGQVVNPVFRKCLEELYKAPFGLVDFLQRHEEIRQEINAWVAKVTNDKIQDLLPAGSVSGETRMMLVSAIHFKDKWETEFDPKHTSDDFFRPSDGGKVPVSMMHQKEDFGYAESEALQVLEMPYQSGLSMTILLPKPGMELRDVEDGLITGEMEFPGMREEEVRVWLPRFKLESEFSLAGTLADLGMPSAFSDGADFTGIAKGDHSLRISNVVHKAFCEVNEEGTEAAAATGVEMTLCSAGPSRMPKIFRADHPFVFMIGEAKTGNILFVGRVEDPTQ